MILDATFLIDLARGDPGARAFLEEVERGSEALRIAPPALTKLTEGIERARVRPREMARIRELLVAGIEASFTGEHAWRAGELLARASREGYPLDPFDAMTAAIALEEDESLVTRNVRDYGRIAELRVRTY
ncbi:MAG: PIN domain-containing protein [Candidatus Thermoplasmatota archaeon]